MTPQNAVIKLDKAILNDGNGYNTTSGIFTVPTSGVYLLTYSIDNNSKNNTLEVELVVDDKHMGSLKSFSYRINASKTIIMRLTAGESVWLQTTYRPNVSIVSSSFNRCVVVSTII